MHDPDQPLGCFQQLAYGLLGVALYLFCSFASCGGLFSIGFTLPKRFGGDLLIWLAVGSIPLGFLIIGPLIVFMYVLYLRDIRVIQVKDRVSTPIEKEKRKKI